MVNPSTSASNVLAEDLKAYPRPYLSPTDLAGLLGVSSQHIYDQIEKGAIPYMKSGRLILIHKHDIQIYCRERTS